MEVGSVVEDRFELESLAGRGGTSAVYRARDRTTGKPVAVKIFVDAIEHAVDRFEREVALLSSLRDAGIVEHVAHGQVEGLPYLVLEWLEGEDLNARLQRDPPLTVDEVVELGGGVAAALAVAHERGVVHRDVKPSNIFLAGGSIRGLKLIDFGIARVRGGPQFTRFGEPLGTPAYMAPEQARGAGDIDVRADVFALGCVLFECLTGRPPFWAEHPLGIMAKILIDEPPKLRALRPDVPEELALLVHRMLAKDPGERPAHGGAVATSLAGLRPRNEPKSDRPSEGKPATLGTRELQLLNVVFVGRVQSSVARADEAFASTLLAESSAGELDRVLTEVLRYGGWAERLVDGSVVITLPGRGLILDQAASAARCALAVRRAMPSHPMALVTGRAEVTGGFPVGEVIDRGVRLLAIETTRAVAPGEPRGIAIDDVAAGLLDRHFEIAGHASNLELVSERTGPEKARTLLGRPQPFVGRERELKRILSLYETCVEDGAAQAVLVTADAGFGKSRLAREVLLALEGRHPSPTILVGRGEPDRRQVDLGVLATAFRQLFLLQDQDAAPVAHHRVRARVGRHVGKSERDRVSAFLGELVSVHFPLDSHPLLASVRGDRVKLGDQIRSAWEDFIQAELSARESGAKNGGVVFVIEDLQHADAATVNLVDQALKTFADAPFFVLGLARPEVDQAFRSLWPTRPLIRFELPKLSASAASSLARHALSDRASDDVITRIVARADGNAFYLEELVRAVAGGRGDKLPETVLAMLQARLDELDPADRRVLRACSIFGDSFTVGGVRALLGPADAEGVARSLERLVDLELLSSPGTSSTTSGEIGLGFRSAIVREAAYATLTREDRALGHRLAASWLERAGADRDAIVVANHLERAGDERVAAQWFARSAEVALEGDDFAAAIERAERGARAGAAGPLLGRIRLLQTEAYRHTGDNAKMLERAQEAIGLLPARTPPWWAAVANATVAALRTSRADLVEQLVELVKDPPYENLSAAATRLAHYLHFAGYGDVADSILASAMQSIGAFNEDPGTWAWGYRAYASRAIMRGNMGDCAEQLALSVRAFHAAGDVREIALQQIDLAGALVELGVFEEARNVVRESLAIGERIGLGPVVAAAVSHLGLVDTRLGAARAAHEAFDRAIPMFLEQKNRRMEGMVRIYRARLLLSESRFEEAVVAALAAAQLARATPQHLPYALAVAARGHLGAGRTDEALAVIRDAVDPVLAGMVVDEGEAFIRLAYVESLEVAGEHDRARLSLRQAHTRLVDRAARIRDPAWRRSFLERVPENARTIELVRAWLS